MKSKELRALLQQPTILAVPGVADAMTARLVEDAGFLAVYAAGAGIANAQYAMPDIGLVTMTEMIEAIRRIVEAVNIPVIADADTGYGAVRNVVRTVEVYEVAGVAALQLGRQYRQRREELVHAVRQQLSEADASLGSLDGHLFPVAPLTQPLKAILDELQAPMVAAGPTSTTRRSAPNSTLRGPHASYGRRSHSAAVVGPGDAQFPFTEHRLNITSHKKTQHSFGDCAIGAAPNAVQVMEDAAAAAAGSIGHDDLRIGRRVISAARRACTHSI